MQFQHRRPLPWTARQMHELVRDVEDYPRFITGCKRVRLLGVRPTLAEICASPDGGEWEAEIEIGRGGLTWRVVTRNCEDAQSLSVELVSGPFHHLRGQWRFVPGADGQGSEVSLSLDLQASDRVLGGLIRTLAKRVPALLVEAFSRRAEQRFGRPQPDAAAEPTD